MSEWAAYTYTSGPPETNSSAGGLSFVSLALLLSLFVAPLMRSAKWVAYRRAAPMHVVLADFPF